MKKNIALIGRPNVGKSTLFNKFARKKLSLVSNVPGLTRDWKIETCHYAGLDFNIIDTAGIEEVFDDSIRGKMRKKTEQALAIADLVLFMIDADAGITPLDEHFASWLRKQNKIIFLLANKCDTKQGKATFYEAHRLGLGEPIAFSAEHSIGFVDLFEKLKPYLIEMKDNEDGDEGKEKKETKEKEPALSSKAELIKKAEERKGEKLEEDYTLKLAIIGRPNVGKSTLMNALLGEDRVMTGPEAGVTRDAIQAQYNYKNRPIRLVDTAGLRKKAKIHEAIEKMSSAETLRTIRLANIAILVIDASAPIDKQDLSIAKLVVDEGRGLVIALNKWDKVKGKEAYIKEFERRMRLSLAQIKGIFFVTLSALKAKKLDKLMDTVLEIEKLWNARIGTGELNRWLNEKLEIHPPPLVDGRRIRIKYITQIKTRPPTFAIWLSKPVDLPKSYLNYLINGLREDFGLSATPIRMLMRKGKNPYADKN